MQYVAHVSVNRIRKKDFMQLILWTTSLNKYLVNIIIENKQDIGDPEGETVYKDLMINGGYSSVQSVRCGKCLKIIIKAKSKENARKDIVKMCDELRIYNPVVSTFTISGISIVK